MEAFCMDSFNDENSGNDKNTADSENGKVNVNISDNIDESNTNFKNNNENSNFFNENNYAEVVNLNDSFAHSRLCDDSNNKDARKLRKKRHHIKFRKKIIAKIAVSLLVFAVLGNLVGFGIGYYAFQLKNDEMEEVLNDNGNVDNDDSNLNPIVNVSKSVVSITASSDNNQTNIFGADSKTENSGSGIIFYQTGKDVYIVTNYHVISGASDVDVSFGDNKYVSASLVGKHQVADIAVISIKKEDLKNIGVNSVKVAYFGDSDKLNVGDSVIAIGNAFGNGNTATRGIVSVIQKDIPVSNTDSLSVIQTDAAINVGNDGGALINRTGEVIGINTAKYAYYSVEGVGYSISSNMAKPVIEEIMNKTDSPYLGVTVSAITEEIAEENGLPQMGVLVESVVPGSAADMVGIRAADIITGFNSNPVFTPIQLTEAVRKCNVGDSVEVKVIRNGKRQLTFDVILLQDTENNF